MQRAETTVKGFTQSLSTIFSEKESLSLNLQFSDHRVTWVHLPSAAIIDKYQLFVWVLKKPNRGPHACMASTG